jgi:hypothetical protein
VAGFNHAMRVMALWVEFQQSLTADVTVCPPGMSGIGMRKSNLLGRMMRGEEIRRRPCPEHQGRQISAPWDREGLTCGCDGTGWLPNEPDQPDEPARPWWRFW